MAKRTTDIDLNGNKIIGLIEKQIADYVIMGELKVAVGDTDYLPGFYVYAPEGFSATLVKVRYRMNSGASATLKITKNGLDITGLTNLGITTSPQNASFTPAVLGNEDYICPVITAVSGTPKNASIQIVVEVKRIS